MKHHAAAPLPTIRATKAFAEAAIAISVRHSHLPAQKLAAIAVSRIIASWEEAGVRKDGNLSELETSVLVGVAVIVTLIRATLLNDDQQPDFEKRPV
jgi:hypothetical protein